MKCFLYRKHINWSDNRCNIMQMSQKSVFWPWKPLFMKNLKNPIFAEKVVFSIFTLKHKGAVVVPYTSFISLNFLFHMNLVSFRASLCFSQKIGLKIIPYIFSVFIKFRYICKFSKKILILSIYLFLVCWWNGISKILSILR